MVLARANQKKLLPAMREEVPGLARQNVAQTLVFRHANSGNCILHSPHIDDLQTRLSLDP
jgi:hypothetical protein